MRIKSHWAKTDREKSPQEIGGALAFIIWKIGDNALKNTRKADFDIAIGTQYFAFLSEFLIFLTLAADRLVYLKQPAEARAAITSALANRLGEHVSENQSRLMGDDFSDYQPNLAAIATHKQRFLEQLNLRAGEYAEFRYDENGPEFAFIRYLAYCIRPVMDEKDVEWVIDLMISIIAPEALEMVEKTVKDLLSREPRPARAKRTAS